jgi:hypothetical protein
MGAAVFSDVPEFGLTTIITIGLSDNVLTQSKSGKGIRQELLFCVRNEYVFLPWHEILLGVAGNVKKSGDALLRGELIGPAGRLFPEFDRCRLTALLVSAPAFFDGGFFELVSTDPVSVMVVLLPITDEEARFVAERGWWDFSGMIDNGQIDILDILRK